MLKGHVRFCLFPHEGNKDDEFPADTNGFHRHSETKDAMFEKEFATEPVVIYSVTKYRMDEGGEEHEHHHDSKEPPHFEYILRLKNTTTEKAVFKLATRAQPKRIVATVTYWAMGVRIN